MGMYARFKWVWSAGWCRLVADVNELSIFGPEEPKRRRAVLRLCSFSQGRDEKHDSAQTDKHIPQHVVPSRIAAQGHRTRQLKGHKSVVCLNVCLVLR